MLGTKSITVNVEKTNAVLATTEDSPPPSYAARDENSIPDITAAFSNLDLRSSRKPTADQCTAHLKLLEAFHQLREDVALNDGLFGLQDAFVSSTEDERQHAELLTKVREKRWAVYVAKAAKRFQSWWEMVIEPSAQRLQQKNIPTIFEQAPEAGNALLIDQDHLPPLGK